MAKLKCKRISCSPVYIFKISGSCFMHYICSIVHCACSIVHCACSIVQSACNMRFAEMVTKCHKFGFFGKIKIQFFEKTFFKKIFEKNIFSLIIYFH